MTKYQKHWDSEIESLLVKLGAQDKLHKALAFVLSKSKLTQDPEYNIF